VKDSAGQKLAYVHFEDGPSRRLAAKLLSKDEARRIAVNFAKLPELVQALSPSTRASQLRCPLDASLEDIVLGKAPSLSGHLLSRQLARRAVAETVVLLPDRADTRQLGNRFFQPLARREVRFLEMFAPPAEGGKLMNRACPGCSLRSGSRFLVSASCRASASRRARLLSSLRLRSS
jgi:hypothetical protein